MDTPVSGTPRLLLRGEGLIVLGAATLAYHNLGGSWGLFALLFLVPDISLVGYLAGPRAGALAYNAVHTYLAPALLGAFAYLGIVPNAWPLCLIWVAHLGLDRSLGLGLKFASAFRDTHLGVVGRVAPTANA
jgi:hypothetical protein